MYTCTGSVARRLGGQLATVYNRRENRSEGMDLHRREPMTFCSEVATGELNSPDQISEAINEIRDRDRSFSVAQLVRIRGLTRFPGIFFL